MSSAHIQKSIESAIKYLSAHPDECRYTDTAATAVVEEGLRCRAEGPDGAKLITDMPKSVGGGNAAPSPGWFFRAAYANCAATIIAMRSAQLGIALTTLEVKVDSVSDDRGLLGIDGTIAAGPLSIRTHVRIGANGAAPEQLREIVHWAEAHSPVGDAVFRAVPSKTEVGIQP
ncbi:MAG: OsmC family protein [Spirochaetia bacterium]